MADLSELRVARNLRLLAGLGTALLAAVALSAPATAQLVIFEGAGITLGGDPVECSVEAGYRYCESDALTERVLSHDGLAPADRIPLDFHLFLPPEPASGADGNYPLVVFNHGWSNSRVAPGGGLESEFVPYAQGGYAVLAYNARAWGDSCGPSHQATPECMDQWNHVADVRYEVRDTQYFAGLLADELSDTGDPLIDPNRIGITGVSYAGGQATVLASLRDRVMNVDGTMDPWTSPAGKPMHIAAAAPLWPWTDLGYSLTPNGRNLDYAVNNSYFGPLGTNPYGVTKASYNAGLYALGQALSVEAPPGEEPRQTDWQVVINAGEPYDDLTAGPIVEAVTLLRSGAYFIDATEPAPILFNSGWSDDVFPVNEPVRWIHKAQSVHPGLVARLVASDYGHARARGDGDPDGHAAYAKSTVREWFDHYLMGIGTLPGPAVRARTQYCPGGHDSVLFGAPSWDLTSPGEVRALSGSGTVLSSAGPSSESADAFDPIANGDPCVTVADSTVAGSFVLDLPSPDPGGYTVLGSPTMVFNPSVTGAAPKDAQVVARLLDVDASGNELLVARGVYRPEGSGFEVFQLPPMGFHIPAGHHLQLELLGNEAPTHRPSNGTFTVDFTFLELRVPVAEEPDGQQIQTPAAEFLPAGYVPEPGSIGLLAGASLLAGLAIRRRRDTPRA